jgi:hypothetical protein
MDLRVPCRRIYRRCAQAARLCQENMYRAYGSPVHRYASFNVLKSLSDRVIQAGIVTRYVEATLLWRDKNGQGLYMAPGTADLLEIRYELLRIFQSRRLVSFCNRGFQSTERAMSNEWSAVGTLHMTLSYDLSMCS